MRGRHRQGLGMAKLGYFGHEECPGCAPELEKLRKGAPLWAGWMFFFVRRMAPGCVGGVSGWFLEPPNL